MWRCIINGVRKDSIHKPLTVKVGDSYLKSYMVDGVQTTTLEYSYYRKVIVRSGNAKYKASRPTYTDVTCSQNMADYNYFVEWCRKQVGFGNLGWVLDKDILGTSVAKQYHEDICVFVPPILNGFILNKYTSRRNLSLPLGVSWSETEGKFRAFCSQLNGKNKTIGRYNNSTDAGLAYIEFKNSLARDLANTWKGKVDERVVDFLLNYDVVEQSSDGCSTHHLYN